MLTAHLTNWPYPIMPISPVKTLATLPDPRKHYSFMCRRNYFLNPSTEFKCLQDIQSLSQLTKWFNGEEKKKKSWMLTMAILLLGAEMITEENTSLLARKRGEK